jgi:hypothetical protein
LILSAFFSMFSDRYKSSYQIMNIPHGAVSV